MTGMGRLNIPNEHHNFKTLHVDNAGRNATGISWIGINDAFVTADANDLRTFFDAPHGKAFLIYS